MDKSDDDLNEDSIEHALIKEAYAAILEPTRLSDFEAFWEAYMDAQTQKNPDGFDWENTPVNAHIMMALGILERVRTANDKNAYAQQIVESNYGFGIIVDERGFILVSNTDAKTFVDGANFLKDLQIDALGAESILNWFNDPKARKRNSYNFFQIYLKDQDKPTVWFVSPLKIASTQFYLITSVESKFSKVAKDTIGKSLGLSPAESAVAGHLADGKSPEDIRKIRGVKISTVRTQIVNITDKMGAMDIPDIVRIYVSMGLRATAVRSQVKRMEAIRGLENPTIKEVSITLRDGRKFQYFEQGFPRGKTILQIHSLMSGVQFPKSFTRDLVKSGYRMISPSRAGYGSSEPNPKRTMIKTIDSALADMIEVIDILGVDDVIVLTGWAGSIAQRLALKDKRVKGIVLSGAVPVWKSEYLDTLPPRYRNLVKTSIYAPKAVPYLLRVAKTLIDSGKVETFMRGLHKGNSVNPKGLEKDHGTREAFKTLFPHLAGQGVSAFAADLPAIHTDWTHDTRKLLIPITIAMGTENTGQPSDAISEYMKAAPQTKLVKIEGADAYQNATHFEEILQAVDDMWSRL